MGADVGGESAGPDGATGVVVSKGVGARIGGGGPGGMAPVGNRFTPAVITSRQSSAGALPPVIRRIGELSSRPIQTTVARLPVTPQNQASR